MASARAKLARGRFREAHELAQNAARSAPDNPESTLVMASIALEHGNSPAASALCKAVREAGYRGSWVDVLEGRLALSRQDQVRAREYALSACEGGTQDPHVANQIGVLLSRTGRHEKAVDPFRQAVEGAGDFPDYWYNLAIAEQFCGNLTEAEAALRELVDLDPEHAKGWLALVGLASEPDADWPSHLEDLFARTDDAEMRLLLGHAIASLAEGRKEWDLSLEWLDRAKERTSRAVSHDRRQVEALVSAAIEAAAALEPMASSGNPAQPIFIVGMPRSGTTLVERILSSHSQIMSLGELSDFAIVLKQALDVPGQLVLEGPLLDASRTAASLGQVGKAYLERINPMVEAAGGSGTTRAVDKMPFNAFLVPAILKALPDAKVVFLRRSPFDVLFANYRQLFATNFTYYSYAYDFSDTAHFLSEFERMADHFEKVLPRDRFLPVRYEDVVADQRAKTEEVLAFCGLDWEDQCLEFHRNAQPVATASSVQVRSPIYASSVGRWKRYSEGSTRAIAEFARHGITPPE